MRTFTIFVSLLLCGAPVIATARTSAGWILVNGGLDAVDGAQPGPEAAAVAGGHILAVDRPHELQGQTSFCLNSPFHK